MTHMTWHNDDKGHDRAFTDQGYYFNGWAKREAGQRRGKHLAAGYSRADVEHACDVHLAQRVSQVSNCG